MNLCSKCKFRARLKNNKEACCTHPDISRSEIDPVDGLRQYQPVKCSQVNKGDCTLYRGTFDKAKTYAAYAACIAIFIGTYFVLD